jgi:hypothetical protein
MTVTGSCMLFTLRLLPSRDIIKRKSFRKYEGFGENIVQVKTCLIFKFFYRRVAMPTTVEIIVTTTSTTTTAIPVDIALILMQRTIH